MKEKEWRSLEGWDKFSPEEYKEKRKQVIKECGFIIEVVKPKESVFANAHTHGIEETYDHLDFQIVIPLDGKVYHAIFWAFANRIKAGEKFSPGDMVERIIQDFPVKLSMATEGGRDVLRVLMPDKNGKFPGDPGVDKNFGNQGIALLDATFN